MHAGFFLTTDIWNEPRSLDSTHLDGDELCDVGHEHHLLSIPALPGVHLNATLQLPALAAITHEDLSRENRGLGESYICCSGFGLRKEASDSLVMRDRLCNPWDWALVSFHGLLILTKSSWLNENVYAASSQLGTTRERGKASQLATC